ARAAAQGLRASHAPGPVPLLRAETNTRLKAGMREVGCGIRGVSSGISHPASRFLAYVQFRIAINTPADVVALPASSRAVAVSVYVPFATARESHESV